MDELMQTTRAAPLSLATLDRLPVAVATPRYMRGDVTPGIVHFGVGNFHRSHQAVYLDDLMNRGEALDWGIVGAGVTAFDEDMRARLARQDFLTTLVEQDERGRSVRVIGSMIDFIAPANVPALLAQFADPRIRIVSLTITEGGYYIDPATGDFDADHPDIRHDALNPANPRTVFGRIVAGLVRRRAAGMPAFTVMSCDNIPHNGEVTRAATVGLARLADPALADWIDAHVSFPNGMVDRITPATTDAQRAWLAGNHRLSDASPVFCETFSQWVLEDSFSDGRPPLDKVGVTFAPDVSPFELMKIRILNGGHAAIAYPAGLLGIHFVHDAMRHPLIAAFLDRLTRDEIIPQVPPVPGVDLQGYRRTVAERFANPEVCDTIRRLCLDGSNRQPKFIVPTIADALRMGGPIGGLALVSALWCRYCQGVTEGGEAIAPNDPNWERLARTAQAARSEPSAWLRMQDVYGAVGDDFAFASAFGKALRALQADGVAATLERWLRGGA
jgi:mannitol 2-dehydrogenase